MKLLCIDASNPEPQWFYGHWLVEGAIYNGTWLGDRVTIREIPGSPSKKFGGRIGFRSDRFVEVPANAEVKTIFLVAAP